MPLSARDRARIGGAVRDVERTTGLQFAVAIGETPTDARSTAERLFTEQGLAGRPAVLVLVAPARHEVEVLTSAAARARVPDAVCAVAVDTMTERFTRGDLAGGLVDGLGVLAAAAGAGAGEDDGPELPDLIE